MSQPPSVPGATYEFDEFRFEPRDVRLVRRGVVLHAEPKAMKVLEVLLQSSGSLVERDTLLEQVWGRVIVTPGSLTRLIAELRRLLGDDPLKPRFIETVHTKGYRWIAPVAQVGELTLRRSAPPERSIELIGRDEDLTQLELIAATSRLVTLAGPGGTGKTQLALELARRRESQQPNSVYWIDLTAAGDERALPGLITAALDLQLPDSADLAGGLAQALGKRQLLLLLDNCEHLAVSLAALARTVLSRCSNVSIICTSQARLDVPEETVFWVSPLRLPGSGWETSVDPLRTLLESPAIRLLRERAHSITPYFELTRDNASFVVEICRRLDGLPLALELAAARLATLSPQQLIGALGDRFGLLARQAGATQRHGSLREAIEWSYELLEPAERELLDHFGVFFGTWSLDAALAVAGGQAKAGATLNGLQSLVQKSLVIVERGPGGLRYRLLESVRAFACARLDAMDRTDQARLLHARYFARLAATAGEKLLEDDQVVWMDHLDLEWPNLRAAWEWLLTRPVHRAHAVELMVGLRWHFWIRGKYTEAMQWYSEAEALIEECGASDQARLFNGHAIALLHARRLEDALLHAGRAAACAELSDLAWEHAYALGVQAWLAIALGRPQDAKTSSEKAAELSRQLHQPWIEGFTRLGLAFSPVYAQDHAQAVTAMREVASIFDRAPDRHMRMFATVQLALQQFLTGDSIAARGNTLRGLCFARQIANPRGLTGICETSAYIAAQEGHAPLAARLLGAAEAGRQMSGAPQFPYWMKLHDTAWEEICARIGQTAANDIFAAGELAGPRACAPQAAAFLQSETRSG